MPIYDYKCTKCGVEKIDHLKRMSDPAPEHCGQPMQHIIGSKVEIFDTSLVFEHCADTPMQFRSKRELRNYCRANGMTSHYAE